ncbi:MAG: hypothetical protein KY476_03840 [Planctomycetes bacterium]|nr:hypothetical protein [Planctomycetota bacterium]
MPTLLRRLPFFTHSTTTSLHGRTVRIKADQIVVWVSLSPPATRHLDPRVPRFPAILDTGCNHNFVIRERHLIEWAGIHPGSLRRLSRVRTRGRSAVELNADIWLHRNRAGERDQFNGAPPVLLETQPAIIVVPDDSADTHPRLPLLGLRALRWAKLDLHIDSRRCRVTIRRRRRFGLFA